MLHLSDGRDHGYMWDTGRKLKCDAGLRDGTTVFFMLPGRYDPIPMAVENNTVPVPDEAWHKEGKFIVFLYAMDSTGRYTRTSRTFTVKYAPKPNNYAYTPTEVLDWHTLEARIEELEGEGLANAVAAYLQENPVQAGATAEEAAQIEQNKQNIATLDRTKLAASELPNAVNEALAQAKASGAFDGDDYVLTEADKQEIAELVEVPESGTVTDEQIASVVEDYMAENPVDGDGWPTSAKNLLITILRNGVYSTDQSANITALENAIVGNGEEPDVPVEPDEPTHTHSYTSSVTTAATCDTAGVRTYTCSCGHSYTEEIPATGHDYVDGVCTNCGAADPDYEPSENNGWVNGDPYTDAVVWQDGYAINVTTGVAEANTTYSVTDYLPCKGVDAFSSANNNFYSIYMYDDNKTYIGKKDTNKTGVYTSLLLTADGRTPAYFRTVYRTTWKNQGEWNPFVTPHDLPIATPTTVLESGKYYIPIFKVGYTVWNDTGVESENEDHYCTDFIFVKDFASISISTLDTTSRKWVGFYDAEKNYISGSAGNDITKTVPENAYYCRIACNAFPGIRWWIKPNAAEGV